MSDLKERNPQAEEKKMTVTMRCDWPMHRSAMEEAGFCPVCGEGDDGSFDEEPEMRCPSCGFVEKVVDYESTVGPDPWAVEVLACGHKVLDMGIGDEFVEVVGMTPRRRRLELAKAGEESK